MRYITLLSMRFRVKGFTTLSYAILMGLIAMGCSSRNAAISTQQDVVVCHKSEKPNKKLFAIKVADLPKPDWDIQLTLICLQGLVNRNSPSLFIVQDDLDEKWLQWMVERGDIVEVEWLTADQVFDKYASLAQGIVVVDTLIPATFNTGTMLGGIRNYLVATADALEKYSLSGKITKDSSDNVLDLRKFNWKKDVEAYRWFYDRYYDKLSHRMCAMTDPYDLPLRDYMVEFNIPLFWMNEGIDDEELAFVEELLMKLPPNIPCLGWPWAGRSPDKGMGEHMGVILINEYAKWMVCSGWENVSRAVSNLSVHSGTKASLKNPVSAVPELEDKVYLSFIRTDGDGPNFYMDRFRRLWDDTVTHGKFPMAWQLGPTSFDLIPDVVDWYYKHATPNDYFVNALTGIGYIHEENYAYMYPETQRKQIWQEYLELSRIYREKMNLSMLTTYFDMSNDKMDDLAGIGYKGIFTSYTRSFTTSLNNQVIEVNGAPVFRTITGHVNSAETLIKDIKLWVPRKRPAFVFISLSNWVVSLEPIDQALKELGPDYVPVTPEQLVGLYWKSKEKKDEMVAKLKN